MLKKRHCFLVIDKWQANFYYIFRLLFSLLVYSLKSIKLFLALDANKYEIKINHKTVINYFMQMKWLTNILEKCGRLICTRV